MLFYGWIVCKAATGFRGFVGSFLQARPIAYLGKISYGLYVFHNFAAAAVLALASKIGLGKTLAASLPLTILSNALFTMILAMLRGIFTKRQSIDSNDISPRPQRVHGPIICGGGN